MEKAKSKVLFVCVHNAARSQMAEAYLEHFAGDYFSAESAGFEPADINPFVVEVMKEEGIDISNRKSKKVFDFFKQGKTYQYVITVCDEANAERCPLFPGIVKRLHWSFTDPSTLEGSEEEKLTKVREIREQVKAKVKEFIQTEKRYI